MHIVKSFTIEKLWGSAPAIQVDLDDQFNFLIGQNGTGKTTVINLLAAVLTADFERLDRIDFQRVIVVFKELSGRKKNPSIEVTKTRKEGLPYFDINYIFRDSVRGKPQLFDLDALEQERFYRGSPSRLYRDRMLKEKFADLKESLQSLVQISWLSVHRNIEDVRGAEERKFVPAIDQKLKDLNNSLVRYFSSLAKEYDNQTIEFQRKIFLSVLTPEKEESIFSFAKDIDLEDEKNTLAEIFQVLGVDPRHYNHKFKNHFDKLNSAIENTRSNEKAVRAEDYTTLYGAWKVHALVAEYEKLQLERTRIFKLRDSFLRILNNLFEGKKKISISEKNEITFLQEYRYSVSEEFKRRVILPEELSSGEKQLLIILGEALLQQSAPYVYIADEPELSLHVSWQEQLTGAISQLNRNAQIIFATHSPDIVGVHSESIIDMERLLS
ncbi:AAA family ATPase [Pseudomonas tremae]|uniref:AAA family ATPase n=2 Tax=Pseudomonas tremae TaxID=200454 RepID=UPI001F36C700|nr:AAA family ATPase [Pseudomonas tremae]